MVFLGIKKECKLCECKKDSDCLKGYQCVNEKCELIPQFSILNDTIETTTLAFTQTIAISSTTLTPISSTTLIPISSTTLTPTSVATTSVLNNAGRAITVKALPPKIQNDNYRSGLPECKSGDDCPKGHICSVKNKCVKISYNSWTTPNSNLFPTTTTNLLPTNSPGCTTNKECFNGYSCVSGTCEPNLSCETDLDCGEGFACQDRECKPDLPGEDNYFQDFLYKFINIFLKIGIEPDDEVHVILECSKIQDCPNNCKCLGNKCRVIGESSKKVLGCRFENLI